jgi:hypothetical protein
MWYVPWLPWTVARWVAGEPDTHAACNRLLAKFPVLRDLHPGNVVVGWRRAVAVAFGARGKHGAVWIRTSRFVGTLARNLRWAWQFLLRLIRREPPYNDVWYVVEEHLCPDIEFPSCRIWRVEKVLWRSLAGRGLHCSDRFEVRYRDSPERRHLRSKKFVRAVRTCVSIFYGTNVQKNTGRSPDYFRRGRLRNRPKQRR